MFYTKLYSPTNHLYYMQNRDINGVAPSPGLDKFNNIKNSLGINNYPVELRPIITEICKKYIGFFKVDSESLTYANSITHKIDLTDDIPINVKQYRYPQLLQNEIEKQVQQMLKDKIIEESDSPYNSLLWIVKTKTVAEFEERKWRLVIDFRELNNKTINDTYPIPNISEIIDPLDGSNYFSVLDLACGFHQIPMREKDKPKTAFSTPFEHYQFTRMPLD